VTFVGNVQLPETFLRGADLFVLPSRFEGFPNALCEAMACGLPVIAADCPTGPREIIRPEVDGLLVATENPEALARAMARLMNDEKLRRELGRRAREITERFSLTEIDRCWERLFVEVLSTR
jgi:glycosyltransferase involved in cell wall biosynthesis